MNTVPTTQATSVFISPISPRRTSRQASSTGWNRFLTEKVKGILTMTQAVQSLSCCVIYRTILPFPQYAGDILLCSLQKGPNQELGLGWKGGNSQSPARSQICSFLSQDCLHPTRHCSGRYWKASTSSQWFSKRPCTVHPEGLALGDQALIGLFFLTGWEDDNVVWHHVSETRDCLVRERELQEY